VKTAARFYRNQLFLCLASLPMSAAIGALCALFGTVLTKVTDLRVQHSLCLLPLLGAAGALIVWCYGRFGKDSAKGMALFFEARQDARADIPLRLAPMIMASTWLTHLFGGSAGREGAAVQIGGTLGHFVGKRLKIPEGKKILMMSGMAAGFGGLFRTPLAAVFFSLEVFRCGRLEFPALLPALVSAYTASFVSGRLGIEKAGLALKVNVSLDLVMAVKLVALGVLFSLIGVLFTLLLLKARSLLARLTSKAVLRALLSGTFIGLMSLVCWRGRYSGLGENLIGGAFAGDFYPLDFLLKMLFTALSLAAGFTGGEFTPLFSIGATAGAAVAAVFGLPVELCAALGYIGVFTSATNTFFAPLFISAEIFGPRYLPFFAVVCAVAYICNGNRSIYPLQEREGKAGLFGGDEARPALQGKNSPQAAKGKAR